MKIATTCGAIIRNDVGKILVLLRSKNDVRRPVRWDLPGGHAEEGESLEATVAREVLEETGLKVTDQPKLVYTHSDAEMFSETSVNWLFFSVSVEPGEIQLSPEHSEFRWVEMVEAIDLIDYVPKREAVEYLLKNSLN